MNMGRCKCGGLAFIKFMKTDKYVMCNKCNMIWEVEEGRLKTYNVNMTKEETMQMLQDLDFSERYTYAPLEKNTSLLDIVMEI